MDTNLTLEAFAGFFEEILGVPPFPWQERLMRQVANDRKWPSALSLPTGSGKTATMLIAVYHLALEAEVGERRTAAVRIVFAVDRRLVVDDAFSLARTLEEKLLQPPGPVTRQVAQRLESLSYNGRPLVARRLRGGVPREDDWARTPAQPTILCSTVDQVGSRLLFRGYGVSDRAKPIHAGLMGADCRILLDEAHLSEPFRQTLEWVNHYRSTQWVDRKETSGPWGVTILSATPGIDSPSPFTLTQEDYANPVLGARWRVNKPTRLIMADTPRGHERTADENRVSALVDEAVRGIADLRAHGIESPSVGVVVNRVARARAVFDRVRKQVGDDCEVILMVGPARPVDREQLTETLGKLHTARVAVQGQDRPRPIVVVATQCLEAGVDIDLDGMVSDAAPLDSLRQRFGRLNRSGRDIPSFGAIVATRDDVTQEAGDPVYGTSIAACWDYLSSLAEGSASPDMKPAVDFGLASFSARQAALPPTAEAFSPRRDAPVLLPSHLDLLVQTSPRPLPDPEIALYLHGPDRQPSSISVIWRRDLNSKMPGDRVRRLLSLVPPRAAEAVELPIWAVRRWLGRDTESIEILADVAEVEPQDRPAIRVTNRRAFRWTGDDDGSRWVGPSELRPGDTIVVPATFGGVDEFGWNPASGEAATDVADIAAEPYAGKYFAVRVAPGLVPPATSQRLSEVLANTQNRGWRDVRDALLDLDLGDETRERLARLDMARRNNRVTIFYDLYETNQSSAGQPAGVALVAPFGVSNGDVSEDGPQPTTEDDASGSMQGVAVALERHGQDVADLARKFARAAGLPLSLIEDIAIAGYLHDVGKADPRFQALLAYGDPLGPDPDLVLAKSSMHNVHVSTQRVGLPRKWRHEALSVRLATLHASFQKATDAELVLWLIGSHHGWGRPFFPHTDPLDRESRTDLPPVLGQQIVLDPGPGPNSLDYLYAGTDWTGLYERLRNRYGIWGLARLEAVLRLADHRASEKERLLAKGDVLIDERNEFSTSS